MSSLLGREMGKTKSDRMISSLALFSAVSLLVYQCPPLLVPRQLHKQTVSPAEPRWSLMP